MKLPTITKEMDTINKQSSPTNSNPVVSVCIQTYNHQNYIRVCLDSILRQEYPLPVEIILGEDESSDQTRPICMEYEKKYTDQINLQLRNRKDVIYINGRPTGRFNLMSNISAARGKYIALCEGDDYWTDPKKLQIQIDFLEQNQDYSAICSNASIHRQGKGLSSDLVNKNRSLPKDFDAEELFGKWVIPTASIVFRKDSLKFPPWFTDHLSADRMIMGFLMKQGKVRILKESLTAYRKHGSGLSALKDYYPFLEDRYRMYDRQNEDFDFKYDKEVQTEKRRLYEYVVEQEIKIRNPFRKIVRQLLTRFKCL